jgi:hypothetical protein
MTYQSDPKAAGFRPLTINELGIVSGGDGEDLGPEIIVTGARQSNEIVVTADGGSGGFGSSLGAIGFGSSAGYFDFAGWFESLFGGPGGEPFLRVELETEIIVTAPTPQYNEDLGSYAVLTSEGGYVTYDALYDSFSFSYFPFIYAADFVVTGGGTFAINGASNGFGTSGINVTVPSYTYTPDSDSSRETPY